MRGSKRWVIFIGIIVTLSIARVDSHSPVGVITAVLGDVLVDGKKAENNTSVYAQSILETFDGRAILLLAEEAIIQIDARSKLGIKDILIQQKRLENTTLNLHWGTLRTKLRHEGITKKFRLRTPLVALGVRGTDFYVQMEEKQSLPIVATIRGSLELVTDKTKLLLNTNEMVNFSTHREQMLPSKLPISGQVKKSIERLAIRLSPIQTPQDLLHEENHDPSRLNSMPELRHDFSVQKPWIQFDPGQQASAKTSVTITLSNKRQ